MRHVRIHPIHVCVAMVTIYLSSTYEDLKEYRRVVFDALRKSGYQVIAMEDYVATDQRPVDKCLKDVEQADIYVGLFAFRYGYIPPPQHNNPKGLSITELEFRRAEALGKPCLIFVVNDTTAWPRVFDDAYISEDKGEHIKSLRLHMLKEKQASPFSAPHELSTLVLAATMKHSEGNEARPSPIVDWPDGKSPYPGLLWFTEDYAPLFFGRDREVEAVLAKMCEPQGRFLIISGDSGSGKSSLVSTGLWRALVKDGQLPGSGHCRWLRMTPGAGSWGPFASLASGLQQAFPQMTVPMDELAVALEKDHTAFKSYMTTHLTDGQELVLFIDQLEELFTQKYSPDVIQSFLSWLGTISGDLSNRLREVTTIRSDFWGRLAESESIRQRINEGFHYLVGPIAPTALLEMIQKPAAATRYTFEPGLVDEMLKEAGKEPGNLPLVAYALKQLFEQRQDRTFTHLAYQAMGGVAGAIGSKADQVMKTLGDEARDSFDRVFAELVHLERDRTPTRKRVPVAVFQNDARATQLIRTLARWDCRILVTGEQAQEPTVEVAHEKLFTAWPKLKKWIDESGTDLRLIEYEEESATRWHDQGQHLQMPWPHERVRVIQQALARFKKTPSSKLETLLHPRQLLIEKLNRETLSHRDRLCIGQELAELGDARPGVGLRDGLPDIVWVDIPGGQVRLEMVDHVFEVKPFRMAKYLVTNAQFEAFIKAEDGYNNEEWWNGIKWSEESSLASWREANSPRDTVSWFEAVAFCRWLSHRTESIIRLPTEWEWQQAASGGDSTREYPWGKWDASRCNSDKSGLHRTTAVGMYPRGATQQGVMDMAGNLWEWCVNIYEQPEAPESPRIDAWNTQRVLHGGSWYDGPVGLRASSRPGPYAGNRNNYIGFRLAQDIP